MRHILRHGDHTPTIRDLEPFQMGIDTNSNNLYVRVGDDDNDIVQLNDNSTLEQQEIRTWRFTADKIDSGLTETPIVRGVAGYPFDLSTDLRITAVHNGWDVTELQIKLLFEEELEDYIPADECIECFTLKGEDMIISDTESVRSTLPVTQPVNEWILSVSETYSFKIGVYKTAIEDGEEEEEVTQDKQYQTLIVVESLGFLSEGGIVL